MSPSRRWRAVLALAGAIAPGVELPGVFDPGEVQPQRGSPVATRYVAVRISPRRRHYRAWAGGTAALSLAFALEVWLVVVGIVAAALSVGRSRHRRRKRLLPALLAGRALLAQREPAAAVEGWAATWLAVLAAGSLRHLRRAAHQVRILGDPWRAHVATSRLEAAEVALNSGEILGLTPSHQRSSPSVRVVVWGGLSILLLALSDGGAPLPSLLPIGVTLAGLTFSLNDLHEARALPDLLARQASDLEVMTGLEGHENTPVPDLIVLAGGDHRCLHHARRLIENDPRPLRGRDVAVRHLRDAESTVQHGAGRYVLVSDGGLHWWIGCLIPALTLVPWG